MKKLIAIIFGMFILTSCGNSDRETKSKIKKDTVRAIGKAQDEHGCSISGGYTWSKIKQECIQVFNTGFRLNPVENKKGDAVISAFILLSDDQSQLELFLPDNAGQSLILHKVGRYDYQNKEYRYDAHQSVLYVKGKVMYKGNVE